MKISNLIIYRVMENLANTVFLPILCNFLVSFFLRVYQIKKSKNYLFKVPNLCNFYWKMVNHIMIGTLSCRIFGYEHTKKHTIVKPIRSESKKLTRSFNEYYFIDDIL